jgi:hypothetical protein
MAAATFSNYLIILNVSARRAASLAYPAFAEAASRKQAKSRFDVQA